MSDSRYSKRVMPKMGFFSWKEDERHFCLCLELMLTLDKMQNASPLMCTKFEIWGQSILTVIQAFRTIYMYNSVYQVFWLCSGGYNKINMYAANDQITGPEHPIHRTMHTSIYQFSPTPLINSIKQEHSCKILSFVGSVQPETDNTGVIVAVVIAVLILLIIIIIAYCYW